MHRGVRRPKAQGADFSPNVEEIEKLEPASLAEEDKAKSLALFGQGRLHYQQEEYAKALACYQRAWRWNQDSGTLLWDIVPLAFHLDRHETAKEYAILAIERQPRDPELMHGIAMAMSQDRTGSRVLAMLDKAIELQVEKGANGKNAALVEMHIDRALVCAQYELAGADTSAIVVEDAIANPNSYGMTKEEMEKQLGNTTAVYQVLGESYLQAKKYEHAEKIYRQLYKTNDDATLWEYHQALLASRRDNWEQSLEHLEKCFAAESTIPSEEPYKLLQTIVEKKYGKGKAAGKLLVQLEKLLNRDPDNPFLADFAARRYIESERFEDAIPLIEPTLVSEPTVSGYRMLMESYRKTSDADGIVALLGKAVDVTGNLIVLGDSLDELLEERPLLEKVVARAQKKLKDKRRPMNTSESLGVGMMCLQSKEHAADEKQYLDFAIRNEREPERIATLKVDWAEQCMANENYEVAIPMFQDALSDPSESLDLAATTEVLAMCQELNGNTEDAKKTLDEYLAKDPNAAGIFLRKGWVVYHSGNPDDAIPFYQAVITQFGDDYETPFIRETLREARITLSSLYVNQEEFESAEEVLLRVLDEFPNDVGAQNDLGYLWADLDIRLDRALGMIEAAVAEEPENGAYLDSLGWVNYRLGNFKDAVKHIQKAVDSMPDPDGIILDHLGDALLASGKSGEAVERWKQAVKSLESADRPPSESDDRLIEKIQSKITAAGN